MAIVNTLEVVLTASTEKFNAGMKKATGGIKDFAEKNKTLGQSLGNAKNALLGINPVAALAATAVAATAGALVGATVKSAQFAEQLQKDAIRIGTTTEALSQLGFAAEQSGSSPEALTRSLTRLNQAAGEAINGNQMLVDEFERVGVSVEELKSLSPDELFKRVAGGLNEIPGAAAKAGTGTKLLGGGFRQLKPLLEEGAEGIEALQQEADSLGRTVSTQFANQSAEFLDNLNRVKSVGKALGQTVGEALLPVLNRLLEITVELAKDALPIFREVVFAITFQMRRLGAWIGIVVERIKELLPGVEANEERLAQLRDTVAQSAEEYRKLRDEISAQETAQANAKIAAEQAAAAELARAEALERTREALEAVNELIEDGEIDFEPTAEELGEIEQMAETDLPAAFEHGFSQIQLQASSLFDDMAERVSGFLEKASSFAQGFGDALVDAAIEGKAKFADFFTDLLKRLAKAIARALVLRAILGIFGLGFGGFFRDVGRLLVGTGGGQLIPPTRMSSIIAAQGPGTEGGELRIPSSQLAPDFMRPRVTVNILEPSPLTQAQFVDDVVAPRMRQRKDELNEEDF